MTFFKESHITPSDLIKQVYHQMHTGGYEQFLAARIEHASGHEPREIKREVGGMSIFEEMLTLG